MSKKSLLPLLLILFNTLYLSAESNLGTPIPNNPPVANSQHVNVLEDVMREITLTASDSDGNPLTYSIVTGSLHGTLNGAGPNYTYTPASNYYGSDSFTFKVNDGTTNSNTATVTITVIAVNDPPQADDQNVITDEDVQVSITLTASDVDGGTLFFVLENQPAHGTLTGLAPNLIYTPNPGYSGTDSFNFVANDGDNSCYQSATSPPATVSITVNDVPHPPTVNDQTITADEDTPKNITLSGNDFDGDGLSFSIVSSPTHGMLTGILPNITYTPNDNYYGEDSFSYLTNDGSLDSNVGLVSITITAVNDAPVATSQNLTGTEDLPLSILLAASDPESDALTFVIVTPPIHGTLSGSGASIQYTPSSNYNGSDSFTYKASDGKANSNLATIGITLAPINDSPIANAQNVIVTEDIEKSITLTGSDIDGNTLIYTIINAPSKGILTGTAPNLNYKPGLNYNGLDGFSFQVSDGITTSSAVVSITVDPVNDPPSIMLFGAVQDVLSFNTLEDASASICFEAIDVDGDITQIKSFNQATSTGRLSIKPDGADNSYCLEFDPIPNYNGQSTWSLNVCDPGNACAPIKIKVSIIPVNDPPIAVNDYFEVESDVATALDALSNDLVIADSYQEFYDLFLERDSVDRLQLIKVKAFNGSVSIQNNKIQYTPKFGYHGKDSIQYWIRDSGGLKDSATVFLDLSPAKFKAFQAVSPNGDELNDYWHINGIEQDPNNNVKVFDRYNNLVFETENYDNEKNYWYGQANNGLNNGTLSDGTYYYTISIDLKEDDEGRRLFSGYLILKRN